MARHPLRYGDRRRVWARNGDLHRKDGPAVEDADGYKAWYKEGSGFGDVPISIEWPGARRQEPRGQYGEERLNYRIIW